MWIHVEPLLHILIQGPISRRFFMFFLLFTGKISRNAGKQSRCQLSINSYPIGSMYALYGNIYHQYTPNVSIYNHTWILWVLLAEKNKNPEI